jgi:hypothetical protein
VLFRWSSFKDAPTKCLTFHKKTGARLHSQHVVASHLSAMIPTPLSILLSGTLLICTFHFYMLQIPCSAKKLGDRIKHGSTLRPPYPTNVPSISKRCKILDLSRNIVPLLSATVFVITFHFYTNNQPSQMQVQRFIIHVATRWCTPSSLKNYSSTMQMSYNQWITPHGV